MVADFVTLADYYTGQPVAVRADHGVVVSQINDTIHLEIIGGVDAAVVRGPFADVVARLNGEDQTDGR